MSKHKVRVFVDVQKYSYTLQAPIMIAGLTATASLVVAMVASWIVLFSAHTVLLASIGVFVVSMIALILFQKYSTLYREY